MRTSGTGAKTGDCVGCHNGIDVGTHVYTPIDPNHFDETTHTASPFTTAFQGAGPDGACPGRRPGVLDLPQLGARCRPL